MRPTVEYKGWAVWGSKGVVRHLCPYKPPSTGPSYSLSCRIFCASCGTSLPDEVLAYFKKMHKLLTDSGM